VIDKHRWSVFYGTRLDPLLSILGTRLLIVCGAATNTCVETTVRDAYMRDLDVVIVSDCVAGVNTVWHETALEVWTQYVGELVTCEELVQGLTPSARGDRAPR
jgi:ureidoacrylate peracid hydrolase